MKRRALLSVVALVGLLCNFSKAADFVWIEGENPTESNYAFHTNGWGNAQYLSEDAWASLGDGDKKAWPDDDFRIAYDFDVKADGKRDVWARLGLWGLWYPFEWRIDEGEWQMVSRHHTPVLDAMPIQEWNKLVWVRLGAMDLASGKHKLNFRIRKVEDAEQHKKTRLLWAADAFCLVRGPWRPNGEVKPGAEWRTEQDLQAERHVFELPEAGEDGMRTELSLEGIWQLARYDEPGEIEDRLGPIDSIEEADQLHWTSMQVPGDRNKLRSDLLDAHRFLYRTHVRIPKSHAGKSVFLDMPMQSMITTVFVNGQRCGYTWAPFTHWAVDLTPAIKLGQINEIVVGIKDCFYGVSPELLGNPTREFWIAPMRKASRYGICKNLDMPVAMMWHAGILDRPLLVSAGSSYAADVFPQTSVKNGTITLDITLRNPSDRPVDLEVRNEVTPAKGGDVEKRFAPMTVRVPASSETTVQLVEEWKNPTLWWPDRPHLYHVKTTVNQAGQAVDIKNTRFGFREWDWSGTRFKLNGIVWKLWERSGHGSSSPEGALAAMRAQHMDMSRWHVTIRKWGMSQREWLSFCDENGIITRITSPFEGMMHSYDLKPSVNPAIWENVEHMLTNWAKGLRNHPSLGFWSLQNEVVLINVRNVNTGGPLMDRLSQAVMDVDPTRPTMNDGAGATGEKIPITGIHYPNVGAIRHFPDEAYTWKLATSGSWGNRHGSRAVLDMTKPVFTGEGYYTGGKNPDWFAAAGGETCFRGISACDEASSLMGQILCEGMRWQGIAASTFLTGPGPWQNSCRPIALLCRQWDWTHASGAKVPRTFKVFNMTRFDDPITARWTLTSGNEELWSHERRFDLAPGTTETFDVELQMPETDDRAECELTLACTRGGEEVFKAVKQVSVVNPDRAAVPEVGAGDIAVIDPAGSVQTRLRERGIVFTEADGVASIPANAQVVIVGADAVSQADSKNPAWRQLAADGKRVLVLDQAHPLLGPAVGEDFKTSGFTGRIAFGQDMSHPVFEGIEQKDLFCRSGDHVVYRNAYKKPAAGGRSLVQCDEGLTCSALLECSVNEGVMLLCQVVAGSKLAGDPVAQRMFDNLLNYAVAYERIALPAAIVVEDGHPIGKLLTDIKLTGTRINDPLKAIKSGRKIVVAEATSANLTSLADHLDSVRAFTEQGGWLMLWGVTPEGLPAFNKLVGVEHVMRPFRQERVTVRQPRDLLAIGLAERDVALTSGRKYTRFSNTEIPSTNAFSYVVDFDDIAPFCTFPEPAYFKHLDADPLNAGHHPLNMVNNLTSRDMWRFIFYIHLFDDAPSKWDCRLPRQETITGFEIVPNTAYHHLEKVVLGFDGGGAEEIRIEPYTESTVQQFHFDGHQTEKLTIDIQEWDDHGGNDVIGVDNMAIRVKRSDEFYDRVHPLLSAGVLNRYPQGQGGIILNQIKVMANEPNHKNAIKKASMVKALLTNLHAAFGGEDVADVVDMGEYTRFTPIVLSENANLFLDNKKNWPTKDRDLSKLPLGDMRVGQVPYNVFDNILVPGDANVVGMGTCGAFEGHSSTRLDVGAKADAICFLHTFVPETKQARLKDGMVLFAYVVHYQDGKTLGVPVRYGKETGSWLQAKPVDLPGAKVAWQAPTSGGLQTVAYQMTWRNVRPDVAIQAIEMRTPRGGHAPGMGVIVAVTAATR